jgi:hypothetical protein
MTTRTNNKPMHTRPPSQRIPTRALARNRRGLGTSATATASMFLLLVGQDIAIRKVKADTATQPSENADQLNDEAPS